MAYKQNSKYLLSVIVPVYNAEKYLKECLDSIINQTLKGIQIIIVNDGSTDGSLNIIKEFQNRHKNITVVNQHNKGVTSARLKGLSIATGEYVAWVDNDDILECDMYKLMHDEAVNENANVVICSYKFYPNPVPNKAIWFNDYKGTVDWNFVHRNSVIWNKIYKKQYLDSIKFSNLLKTMDESSFVLTLIHTQKIKTINNKLYNYRVGHGSLSSYKNLDWYLSGVRSATSRSLYIKNNTFANEWLDYFNHLTFISYLSAMIVAARLDKFKEYVSLRNDLYTNNLINNKYNKIIICNDFGVIKYLFLRYIVVSNYFVTKYCARLFL